MNMKHIILTGVLLAPMTLSSGIVIASSTQPSATDVIINKVVSATDQTDGQNIHTNDGTEISGDWEVQAGAKFTVYKLPNDAISGYDAEATDKPKIKTSYQTYLEVVAVTVVDNDEITSPWTIKVKEGKESEFKTFLNNAGDVSKVEQDSSTEFTTDSDGKITLDNLADGHYVAFETGVKPNTKTHAVPMVISLPMMDRNGSGETTWFDDGSHPYNLYAKNYSDTANLTVKKVAENGTTAVGGAWVGLLNISDIADEVKSGTLLQDAVSQLTHDMQGKTFENEAALKTAISTWIDKMKTDHFFTDDQATIAQNLLVTKTSYVKTDSEGKAKYLDLDPGSSYYVAELVAPKGYMANGKLQQVNLSAAEGGNTEDVTAGYGATDNDIYYQGATFNLVNYGDVDIEKTVDTNQDNVFGTSESEQSGISRGEDFTWRLKSDVDADIADYKKYDIVDNMPYQVDWLTADIGLDYDNDGKVDESLAKILSDIGSKNGMTGEGLAYNSDDISTGITFANESTWTKDDIKISGTTSKYEFDTDNRVVKDGAKNGTLTISLTAAGRAKLATLLQEHDGNEYSAKLIIDLGSRANRAAQAGEIENEAEVNVDNGYITNTDKDTEKTYTAGWEIIKTDGNANFNGTTLTNALSGAGFDLAMKVTADNKEAVWGLLYENTANGHQNPSESGKSNFANKDALETWLAEQNDPYVYFMHVAEDGKAMAGMTASDDMTMGDIIWSIYPENATTHITGDDGYLQYCGLAGGDYKLIESKVPSGYKKMADKTFTLSGKTSEDNGLNGKGTGVINGHADESDVNIVNYKKSMFPVTGGIGMIGALLVGAMLMIASRIKKRKAGEQTTTLIRK